MVMGEVVLVAVALGVGFLFAFALMRWRRGDGREELERLEALREQLRRPDRRAAR